ncbi:hypothetical protein [Fusobacterium sp.]|uniref:hypothetical protein n=1 Tax=Fusobacterium sp. TaxID=68766 RepID=UPI002626A340|nr:hypothetical protein [Fusobacterium sp.]
MGIDIDKSCNEINFIIRTEEGKDVFSLNENDEVEKLVFDIYTQCFNYEDYFMIQLFFVYSEKQNSLVENLSFFEIGTYEISKNGFIEKGSSGTSENSFSKERSNNVGITNGFRSDLKLTMNKIKLNPGYYEITAITNDKILGLYPFKVIR